MVGFVYVFWNFLVLKAEHGLVFSISPISQVVNSEVNVVVLLVVYLNELVVLSEDR